MSDLAYLYGEPDVTCFFKQFFADFQVTEILPFTPCGEGEHLWIELEKTGENTMWAAEQLARCLKVSPRQVSFAGLKDRQGITRQWFSIQYPISSQPDLTRLPETLKVLQCHRNLRKLRRGALSGNHFTMKLRHVNNIESLTHRIDSIKKGVPNYFGPQRFGHDGSNLQKAEQMFAGKRIKNRDKRSLYISAARSFVFNQLVSARIRSGLAHQILSGDCMILSGSHSYFIAHEVDDELRQRLAQRDIRLSGPLVGAGKLPSEDEAYQFEMKQLEENSHWLIGLERVGLKQERRPLLVVPEELSWQIEGDSVNLSFYLPAGSYATSVIRELACFSSVYQGDA
ncbi:MAG: tRNA pseudouridine synthase D [Candidatus Celerinatantimonas neptuna]|nr:MAG: tRNA pseudouridine synthase D [Candidatus Celerinatantimonas neptuna]